MQSINQMLSGQRVWLCICLLLVSFSLAALESDRQKPLEVSADSTDGTLGDGVTILRGNIDIRQGTLHIMADEAEVSKVEGRVNSVTFRGSPASLEQEIEEQGMVNATAKTIEYQVASGLVMLQGDADVQHPQYQISGDLLTYDLNVQHFQGSSDENGNGRIHIRLDPEVIDKTGNENDETGGTGEQEPDKASEDVG